MTVQVDGTEIGWMIELGIIVGTMLSTLVIGLIIYLLVRPPRRLRKGQAEEDRIATEDMVRLMERMEARMDVLEQLVSTDERGAVGLINGKDPETRREQ